MEKLEFTPIPKGKFTNHRRIIEANDIPENWMCYKDIKIKKVIACGICRDKTSEYVKRNFLTEKLHGWGANPDYYQVSGVRTLYVCSDCANKPYTLKHTGTTHIPY